MISLNDYDIDASLADHHYVGLVNIFLKYLATLHTIY